jgi:hypothetical protein
MKSPYNFIVKSVNGKRYNNLKSVGGIDLITSTSQEDHMASSRYAEVIETPLKYKGPISVGDTLLVHHNVFKFYNDVKGRQRSGRSYFKDDLFFIDDEQFFLYHNGTEWKSYDRYCFVKPIPVSDSYIFKPFSEEPLVGMMKYPSEYLISKGVNQGDMVTFSPENEYEFTVDDEKLYRIYDHQISMVI